jgi:hypothetical protein
MFVATPGPSFAAVLAHVQEVAASQLRLAEHAELSAINLSAARQSAADANASGKALLAADKAAIKAAGGDAAALQAARGKLAADKAQVRADVLAAKTQAKSLQVEARAASTSLKAALKEDRALLGAELKTSDAAARKAVNKLLNDWQAMQIGSDLTSADMQALADDLAAAADGATQPTADSVDALRAHALAALVDGDLSDADSAALLVDLHNVFATADISDTEADKIVDDVAVIMEKITLPPDELAVIVHDVELTLMAFSAA